MVELDSLACDYSFLTLCTASNRAEKWTEFAFKSTTSLIGNPSYTSCAYSINPNFKQVWTKCTSNKHIQLQLGLISIPRVLDPLSPLRFWRDWEGWPEPSGCQCSGGFPGLLDKFDGFLEGDKSMGTTTKKRKRSEDYLSDEPKFSNCRRATLGRITYRKNRLKESPRNQSWFTKQIFLLIGLQERRNN